MFSFWWYIDKRNGLNIDICEIILELVDNVCLLSLCGLFDDNIKQFERCFGIEINCCDNYFKLIGCLICVIVVVDILCSLYVDIVLMCGQIQDIELEQIYFVIKEVWVLE